MRVKKLIENVNEAKARNVKKVKAALSGKNDLIKTWGIITAENPLGLNFPEDINAIRDKSLRTKLAQNNMEYIKVKGQYGNPENSLFIINPSLADLEKIASDFCQESFIFATNTKDGDFSFDAGYYETNIPDSKKEIIKKKLQEDPEFKPEPLKYTKSITKKNIIDQKDADDFFTSIDTHGRKFKFQIPFFESTIRRAYERIVLCTEGKDLDHVKYDINRTTIDADQYTSGSRWRIRGSLYKIKNEAKEITESVNCEELKGADFWFTFKDQKCKVYKSSDKTKNPYGLNIPSAILTIKGKDGNDADVKANIHVGLLTSDIKQIEKEEECDIRDLDMNCSVISGHVEVTEALPFTTENSCTLIVDWKGIQNTRGAQDYVTLRTRNGEYDLEMQKISFDIKDPVIFEILK